jgi:hypothetical protein
MENLMQVGFDERLRDGLGDAHRLFRAGPVVIMG